MEYLKTQIRFMKNNLVILFLLCCIGCQSNTNKKQFDKCCIMDITEAAVTGVYTFESDSISLIVCAFEGQKKYKELPSEIIDTLIQQGNLFKYFVNNKPINYFRIDTNKKGRKYEERNYYRNDTNKKHNDCEEKIYYKIIDKTVLPNIKKTGKLYRIGNLNNKENYWTHSKNGGEVFLSDTTKEYECFAFYTPLVHEDSSMYNDTGRTRRLINDYTLLSKRKKAKKLVGIYKKLPKELSCEDCNSIKNK